jgi:hypothetical protein
MESDSGKPAKGPGLCERRYVIRYPFAADAEMLELESGTRVSGVTSDLSPGGCFVCARRPLKVGARLRGTLTHDGQKNRDARCGSCSEGAGGNGTRISRSRSEVPHHTAGMDQNSSQIPYGQNLKRIEKARGLEVDEAPSNSDLWA